MVFGLYELIIIVVDPVLHYRAYYASKGNATFRHRSCLWAIKAANRWQVRCSAKCTTAFFVRNPAASRFGNPGRPIFTLDQPHRIPIIHPKCVMPSGPKGSLTLLGFGYWIILLLPIETQPKRTLSHLISFLVA